MAPFGLALANGRWKGMAVKRSGTCLELAVRARDLFVPYVVTKGIHEVATVQMPTHWRSESWRLRFIFAEGVVLLPTDKSLSNLFDVWSASPRKELSISWEPERPWQPPHIASFNRRGAWIPLLDLLPPIPRSGAVA